MYYIVFLEEGERREAERRTLTYFTRAENLLRKSSTMSVSRVGDIDLKKITVRRVGVIPYVVTDGKKGERSFIFGMGVDTNTSDLTDFGGSLKTRDKTVVHGALREFEEESLEVFCISAKEIERSMSKSVILIGKKSCIIFIRVECDPDVICNLFSERRAAKDEEKSEEPEMQTIIWMDEKKLRKEIKSKDSKIYSVTLNLLRSSEKFFAML